MIEIDNANLPLKAFIHNKRYFLYTPISNRLLEITKPQYSEVILLKRIGIKEYLEMSNDSTSRNDVITLIKKGVICNSTIQNIEQAYTENVVDILSRSIHSITLQVTRKCNFVCRYCLFGERNNIGRTHSNEFMPYEIAKKSIDFLYEHSYDSADITVAFYGGEPLINFELIKKIVEYSENIFHAKKITFRMTTNGSLLNENISDYLADHQFVIAISLDGPEHIQNKHRKFNINGSDTFSRVMSNIDLLSRKYPEYYTKNVSFIPVVFPDQDYTEVYDFFANTMGINEKNIIPLIADLGGIDYTFKGVSSYDSTLSNSLEKLDDGKMKDIAIKKQNIPLTWNHGGQCLPGFKDLFVDFLGNFYPCEKAIESSGMSIGNLHSGLNVEKILSFFNIGRLTEEECKSCWAMRFCEICVVHCYDLETDTVNKESKLRACDIQKRKVLTFLKHYIDGFNNSNR